MGACCDKEELEEFNKKVGITMVSRMLAEDSGRSTRARPKSKYDYNICEGCSRYTWIESCECHPAVTTLCMRCEAKSGQIRDHTLRSLSKHSVLA